MENNRVITIEIFRTTISTKRDAKKVLAVLSALFPNTKATIDLMDCDRVLRMAGEEIQYDEIIEIVKNAGFVCEVLE